MKYALFFVGQRRSIIDVRMQLQLKEAIKHFHGDIFFVLEEDENNQVDLSIFNPREVFYYKKYRYKVPGPILMAYGWTHCMTLIQKYEEIDNGKYDIIYKSRPDLLLRNYIPMKLNIHEDVLNKKVVWGETIGLYGTQLSDPKFALKDTFNVVTRKACEDFFVEFHNFALHRFLSKDNVFCAEALLGHCLFLQNVEKRVVDCKRNIIRMNTLYEKIEDIEISGEISLC